MTEEFSENNNIQQSTNSEVVVEARVVQTPDSPKSPASPSVSDFVQQSEVKKSQDVAADSKNKNMWKCWAEALTNMLVFSGRTSRYEFWAFQSVSLVIFLFMALIGYFLSEPKMVLDIFAVYFLLPATSSCVRRLHDISTSGKLVIPAVILALATLVCWNLGVHNMVLLLFATLVYISYLFNLLRQSGDKTDNKYGKIDVETMTDDFESRECINFMKAFEIGLWIIFAAYLFKF